ncbi:hypothetical protein NW768_011027 [Fusarium equiseti]|uniref:Uncharacterized protein n=1 Tax=Fusarium equiseti TaxID=61235 RepID=A0ABQ8QYI9_FUSEQ|nr:hypothetical protein NW768_011027 [Fusarium equiseti]
MVDQHPMILGDARDILQGVSDLAAEELVDETALCLVLIPDLSVTDKVNDHIPIGIVDWELSQLGVRPIDLGQLIAELWSPVLYRNVDAVKWLVRAFASGYGSLDGSFAYRTIIDVGVQTDV